MFDHRMTLHSSRRARRGKPAGPDSAIHSVVRQRLDRAQWRRAGSNPALGALQLFQANIITQSRLLSYIDIYLGLAVLSGVAAALLALARLRPSRGRMHWHVEYSIRVWARISGSRTIPTLIDASVCCSFPRG
jgi:DHA2 family multidrug resistance protein